MVRKRTRPPMTDEHKQALAIGRSEGRAVRLYLEALELHAPKRGRKRTAGTIRQRLHAIDAELEDSESVRRLQLIQERLDLEAELESLSSAPDLATLEEAFVEAAGPYSRRKGISYAAWRELGIEPSVLRRAGIRRN